MDTFSTASETLFTRENTREKNMKKFIKLNSKAHILFQLQNWIRRFQNVNKKRKCWNREIGSGDYKKKILRTGENRMLARVLNDIVTYFHIRKQQKKTKGDILSL